MMYACVYEQNGVGLEQFFVLSYSLARPEIIFELRHTKLNFCDQLAKLINS